MPNSRPLRKNHPLPACARGAECASRKKPPTLTGAVFVLAAQAVESPQENSFTYGGCTSWGIYQQFELINPVVKAPTLICDDGSVLMDSTLILEYAQAFAHPRSLMPADLQAVQHDLRVVGLALAACEKSVQIVYERHLRPPEKLHEPWIARVTGQLLAAYGALEAEVTRRPLAATSSAMTQAGVTAAVAWHFTQQVLPEVVPAANFPSLVAFSSKAEVLPEFKAAPYGDSTYRHEG